VLQDRIRFVTANFYQLQGLRLVPLGVFLLIAAAGTQGWFTWLPGNSPHAQQRWLAVAYGLAVAGASLATVLYARRFGSVWQFGRSGRNCLIVLAVAIFILLALVDQQFQPPLALAPLWTAAALAVIVCADGWIRSHFLLGSFAWMIVGVLPVLHPDAATMLEAYYVAGGLTLVVCGVGDHFLISRTFLDRGGA
jgi:hypothetical protein